MRCHHLALMLLLTIVLAPVASARQQSLDDWLHSELIPYVSEQLTAHPRFKGETVRFVVMRDGEPEAESNALALGLRDQLRDALVDIPGVRTSWQADSARMLDHRPTAVCTADDAQYLIGLEVSQQGNTTFKVSLRAIDIAERTRVANFTRSWQGPLTAVEHQAYRQIDTDPAFRGDREVPFTEAEFDLLAAHLARKMGCSLLRQTVGEYSASPEAAGDRTEVVQLVAKNLANYQALQFSSDESRTNAIIEGKAHRVDADLYQYWITVKPKDEPSELPALGVSAYVYLPERFHVAEQAEHMPHNTLVSQSSVISSLRLVELDDHRACYTEPLGRRAGSDMRAVSQRSDCYALQATTIDDAVIFVLNHQLNNGLVRMSGDGCSRLGDARIARADNILQIALPLESLPAGDWLPAESWQMNPDSDVYYAIAVSDTQAARAVSRHVQQLPQKCTASVRAGLEDFRLRAWISQFSQIVDNWQSAIDWQSIRVRHVY